MNQHSSKFPRVHSLKLQGYRPFRDFTATLSTLEVIVGANGSGKTSLFEFLKFLRDAVHQEIPPEIVAGSIGQQIFHRPGPDRFSWAIEVSYSLPTMLHYEGTILGPRGQTRVLREQVLAIGSESGRQTSDVLMDLKDGKGVIKVIGRDPETLELRQSHQLGLKVMTNPSASFLYWLREFISRWRFYNAFDFDSSRIRRSVPLEQKPTLHEDGGNLSAVLFYLMTEHPSIFEDLKTLLRMAVPGFRNLRVKARGGPGEVIAFWQEEGVEDELSLSDLSDGTLRFLSWAALCLTPDPPTLICIDEPDQGVHPRTLPILAGLFEKASLRTQLLLATHASYFLTQFDVSRLAVMKKIDGESYYLKLKDSESLMANLEDFGVDELEAMHRSDELEALKGEDIYA